MKEEILKLLLEYWKDYKDEKYSDERGFEDFMDFLENQVYLSTP